MAALHPTQLGIGMHSYAMAWKAAKDGQGDPAFNDALTFLEYAHRIGAAGVQVALGLTDAALPKRIRQKAEEWQMHFESQTSLPIDSADCARFENEVKRAREAGASVMRAALLSGRRYENFETRAAFEKFRDVSWQSLTLAEPILRKHDLHLAVENHKDWSIDEMCDLMRRLSSTQIGICVDVGNNIALLDDPYECVERLAPWAFSTHLKDMAMAPYEFGFLLSEVPLGNGFLDLKRIAATLKKANPNIRWNLEMMTRDPLKVPCLTPKYWATMPDGRASKLAAALAMVRQNSGPSVSPEIGQLSVAEKLALEDKNVRLCLEAAPAFGL